MGRLAVLGEAPRVESFALGGAKVLVADDPESVRQAWEALDEDTIIVVLTPMAAAAIAATASPTNKVLTVVMPAEPSCL